MFSMRDSGGGERCTGYGADGAMRMTFYRLVIKLFDALNSTDI